MTTERSIDELGPVDYLIVEFPAGAQDFTGEGAAELLRLHDDGIIRIMDLLFLQKGLDGTVMAQELGDLDRMSELARLETELVQTLAEDDVENLGAAMDPGSVAAVLVYENLWAAPFASAMRRAGGQLIADGRIPIQAILAAVQADERSKRKESDMLGRRGVGVIGSPVAKAAVVGKAMSPGPVTGRQGGGRRCGGKAWPFARRQGSGGARRHPGRRRF